MNISLAFFPIIGKIVSFWRYIHMDITLFHTSNVSIQIYILGERYIHKYIPQNMDISKKLAIKLLFPRKLSTFWIFYS